MIRVLDRGRLDRQDPTDDTRNGSLHLTYLNNRHYDPTTGVFISVDPLFAQTGEAYVYGAANPITLSDPSGLEVCGVRENSEYHCWDDFVGPSDSQCVRNCLPLDPVEVPVTTSIEDPSPWCGSSNCPSTVEPDHVFTGDDQAIAFLNFITGTGASGIYGFSDSALNSGNLWAHYTTPTGKAAVRWKPGAGWVRTSTGIAAKDALSFGKTLSVGGRLLLVLGGALEAGEQWGSDDGYGDGVRIFRSVAAGTTKAAFTYGGASASGSAATAFCASTATISCGGPWGTAAVVGVASVLGGFLGSKASDVVIERIL